MRMFFLTSDKMPHIAIDHMTIYQLINKIIIIILRLKRD